MTKNLAAVVGALALAARALAQAPDPAVEVERAAQSVPPAPTDAEDRLARRVDLPTVFALALARSPELAETRERVRAAAESSRLAGALPEPTLNYRLWNAPFTRPWAAMHMLGVGQALPAPGTREARRRAGLEGARQGLESLRARELALAAQAQRALADLYRAERELEIRGEHATITARIIELARANYQAGRVSQAEVLRAVVELSRIRADLAGVEQARQSARELLNALMARPGDAPLGPAAPLAVPAPPPELARLAEVLEARPEIASAGLGVARADALAEAARREAKAPAFMVGVDYLFEPMGENRHGFGAMVTVNLPWLGAGRMDEVRRSEREAAAERRALESARVAAGFQLRDAFARHQAARQTFAILDQDLLPQARQSFEAAESGFASLQGDALGLLDAQRSLLQVRLDRERGLAQLVASLADLHRAAGVFPAAEENDR